MHNSYRILIVEDEIIIADTIKRYLKRQGHEVVGIAISYEEAVAMHENSQPDICLLDIRLNGTKTGVDVAMKIQSSPHRCPFIFLTSQIDSRSINAAKQTHPAGYLPKPIRKDSLFATIEIAMHNHATNHPSPPTKPKEAKVITLSSGNERHCISVDDILFLEADHVYVRVHLLGGIRPIVVRETLRALLSLLPCEQFMQTHRSYAVNTQKISRLDKQHVYVQTQAIPISRNRKKGIQTLLA